MNRDDLLQIETLFLEAANNLSRESARFCALYDRLDQGDMALCRHIQSMIAKADDLKISAKAAARLVRDTVNYSDQQPAVIDMFQRSLESGKVAAFKPKGDLA